ncbi:MAG TPA: hypoxanthine phosphoribosyltransferase [Syntrophales bacterium]|nr:hypoxanthine phosphoribosyltransferase [Syntrophales bacterium]HQN77944.1 hypoxanthine phosphoribosyltransferase [Syntrophales bacterium]HQQ26884.1 hypoxanthine phosphoribosyltransferase [Syntrophales bacterium]
MEQKKPSILIRKDDIAKRVSEIAGDIARDYGGRELVLVGVLKGSFVFLADLVRNLTIPHTIDFIAASSYGSGTVSSGTIRITKDISLPVEGKDILLVEDIIDTGTTLAYLKQSLKDRKPRSVAICAFIDKKERRETEIDAEYVGFTVPGGFIVGYGLDCDEKFRYLPDVCVLEDL